MLRRRKAGLVSRATLMRSWGILIGGLWMGSAALDGAAQDAGCATESHGAFDFWVGEWAVHRMSDDALVGHNQIEKVHGGCALVEQWRSANGPTGTSLNYFDPVDGDWHQVWVSNAIVITMAGAPDAEGVMRLAGEARAFATGQSAPFRGAWRRRPDGTVTQVLEVRATPDGPWTSWFEGYYTPAGS